MIQGEIQKEENTVCAECFSLKPEFVSLNLGVFVCQKCSKYHKKLSVDRNNIVAVRGHPWTNDQVDFLRIRGNIAVNQTFEKYLPKYYHRPDPDDPPMIREQFIKAKYEREEFKDTSKQKAYNEGSKTGILYKRGKDNDKFLQRRFVLKEPDGVLEYYIKPSDKTPKDTIIVRNLVNIFVVPEKVGNVNGMQVTYEKDGVRRNLFLYGENGKESSDWYHAIRASMVRHKFQNFPDEQMKKYLNTRIIREGWMSKTGPKRQEKFRKRWFSLVGNMVWYYTAPLDAHPLGYIPLGSRTFGYGVMKGLTSGIKVDGYGFTVHTPERIYALNCATLNSRDAWVKQISEVLDSCTNVWSQPAVGRLGTEKKDLASSNDEDTGSDASPYISAAEKFSKNYRGSSDTSAASSVGSTNSSTRTPLFEKNAHKGAGGGKYTKPKQGSVKRQSTTKKVQNSQVCNDNKDDNCGVEEREVVANGGGAEDKFFPASYSSSRYSDDSDYEYYDGRDSTSSSDSGDSHSYVVNTLSLPPETSKTNEYDLMKEIEKASGPSQAPKKPPRQRMMQNSGHPDSGSSDVEFTSPSSQSRISETVGDKASKNNIEGQPSVEQAPSTETSKKDAHQVSKESEPSKDDRSKTLNASSASFEAEDENPYSFADVVTSQLPSERPSEDFNIKKDWRKGTFSQSIRNVGGHQRISVKEKQTSQRNKALTPFSKSSVRGDATENKPKPVDVTITNFTEKSTYFMLFQTEVEIDPEESYITSWIGAQITESPASVGPMRIPPGIEIAVIDTAPGGFGLTRTTGPFFAEAGDVWEVEIMEDLNSLPELFFHEGMETDDGSVIVYASSDNVKSCEVAVFKNGRKLCSRKNVKPGDAVSLQIKQALYFMAVDEDTFYDLEDEDLKASEYIEKASCIDINFRRPKMKIKIAKRGEDTIFTRS